MFRHTKLVSKRYEYYAADVISLLFYECVDELELDQQIQNLLSTTEGQLKCRWALEYLQDFFKTPRFSFNTEIERARRDLALERYEKPQYVEYGGYIPGNYYPPFTAYIKRPYTERDEAIDKKQIERPAWQFYKVVANKVKQELSKQQRSDYRI